MTYTAKVAVCSEIRTKHSTQSEHHVEFLMLNRIVRKETARLLKAKQYRTYQHTQRLTIGIFMPTT
jgi:hypothetical protein